jgi:hypothetical protein
VQPLPEALVPGNGCFDQFRALARLSRNSRAMSISGRESGSPGMIISS